MPIPSASFGKVQAEVFQIPFFLFYVVGLIAASWHFAYGIWLFSAKWGIVSGEKAQKRFPDRVPGIFLCVDRRGIGQPCLVPVAPAATDRAGDRGDAIEACCDKSGCNDSSGSKNGRPVEERWQLRKLLS